MVSFRLQSKTDQCLCIRFYDGFSWRARVMIIGIPSEGIYQLRSLYWKVGTYPIGGVIPSPLASRGSRSIGEPMAHWRKVASKRVCLEENMMKHSCIATIIGGCFTYILLLPGLKATFIPLQGFLPLQRQVIALQKGPRKIQGAEDHP